MICIGDVVVYRNRQALKRRDVLGLVIALDDGVAHVLWSNRSGRTTLEPHESSLLINVNERRTVAEDDDKAREA